MRFKWNTVMYSLGTGNECRHSYENNVWKHTECSFNCIPREYSTIGDGLDNLNMPRMRSGLHLFDYTCIWLFIWKQSSRQALLLKRKIYFCNILTVTALELCLALFSGLGTILYLHFVLIPFKSYMYAKASTFSKISKENALSIWVC